MSYLFQLSISTVAFLALSINGYLLPDNQENGCGELAPPPPNSRYVKDEKNNLVILCNDGYYREGMPYVKCDEETGIWNNNVTCYKKACGHPGRPKNGMVSGAMYQVGGKVSYECGECFILEGEKERTCLHNESWSGDLPYCKHIECQPLVKDLNFKNGRIHGWFHNKCGLEVVFYCDDGYELIGSSVSTCRKNSTWSALPPFCQKRSARILTESKPTDRASTIEDIPTPEMKCKEPPYPQNGYISNGRFENMYDEGFILKFDCFHQYVLDGPADVMTCMRDGSWSHQPPRCILSYCDEIEAAAPAGGHRLGGNVIGNKYKYFCEPHSKLIGLKEITCGNDGEWSDEPPLCKPLCDSVSCEAGKECKFDNAVKQPRCVCKEIESCPALYEPVCGSDGVTYNNECIMKAEACRMQTKIKTVASGSCIPGGICAIKPTSHCRGYFEVFYFNPERQMCEEIVAGGCHKSGWNGFDSLEECNDTCRASSNGQICSRPAVPGPCKKFRKNWYHDKNENKCKQFQYGGCFGNQNNFETEEDCMRVCPQIPVTSPTTTAAATESAKMESTQKPCPVCKIDVKLCERIKTSSFTFTGKPISEDMNAVTVKVTGIFINPQKVTIKVGGEVKLRMRPSDPNCPCLPKLPSGELIFAGDYAKEGDLGFVMAISNGDYIGKYYGIKQLACKG